MKIHWNRVFSCPAVLSLVRSAWLNLLKRYIRVVFSLKFADMWKTIFHKCCNCSYHYIIKYFARSSAINKVATSFDAVFKIRVNQAENRESRFHLVNQKIHFRESRILWINDFLQQINKRNKLYFINAIAFKPCSTLSGFEWNQKTFVQLDESLKISWKCGKTFWSHFRHF